jgi:hypothetical protein
MVAIFSIAWKPRLEVRPAAAIPGVRMAFDSTEQGAERTILRVPWRKMPSKRRRDIIVPKSTTPNDARPIRAETRDNGRGRLRAGRATSSSVSKIRFIWGRWNARILRSEVPGLQQTRIMEYRSFPHVPGLLGPLSFGEDGAAGPNGPAMAAKVFLCYRRNQGGIRTNTVGKKHRCTKCNRCIQYRLVR